MKNNNNNKKGFLTPSNKKDLTNYDVIKIDTLKRKLKSLELNYNKTKNPSLLSTIKSLKDILNKYIEEYPEYFI